MKKIALLSLSSLVFAHMAFAGGQNEPSYSHASSHPMHRGPNWTGFYAGINLGASGNNNETDFAYAYDPGNGTDNFSDTFGNNADNAGLGAGPLNVNGMNAVQSAIAWGAIPDELGDEGYYVFAGGLQAGYNWQQGHYVLGFEADFQWFTENDSIRTSSDIVIAEITTSTTTVSNVDWLNTDRIRLGYAFGRFLPYLTGGFAVGSTESSTSSQGDDTFTLDTYHGSVDDTRIGWAAGGGMEYLFDMRFNVRLEGIYYNLGDVNYELAPQDANSVAEGIFTTASHTFDGVMIRAAVNYMF